MLAEILISKCVRQLWISTTFFYVTAGIYFQRLHSDCRLRASWIIRRFEMRKAEMHPRMYLPPDWLPTTAIQTRPTLGYTI